MAAVLPAEDLDMVVSRTVAFWSEFAGARLFVTGGTGFFGNWLVQAVQHANDRLDARIELVVLTRDAGKALARSPSLSRPDTRLVTGDVVGQLPSVGQFDLCIHAATDVADSLNPSNPLKVFDSIVHGTRQVLDLAAAGGARRFLLASSGAVYGPQPADMDGIAETFTGAPDVLQTDAAYGNGKRAAEWLACAYAAQAGARFATCSARIFAVVGPGMPLDGSFAVGNFIRDVVSGKAIRVHGDGRALRSYLYMADVCVWLLRILGSGASGAAYNVGSRHAISISGLARSVVAAAGREVPVEILSPATTTPPPRYVPDNRKACDELALAEYTPLHTALAKTIEWSR